MPRQVDRQLPAALFLQGGVPVFGFVLAVEAAQAVGETFIDGALRPGMADEVGEDGLERVFVGAAQVRQVGGLVRLLAGVGLATVDLGQPLVVGGAALCRPGAAARR